MSEEGVEETYSTIFSALKHPVRRKIMRMLSVDGELAYTEILNSLGIDSGHLNYHLESLGELVAKTEGGKYKLSSFGRAAVHLMGDIEEVKTREIRVERLRATRGRLMHCLPLVLSIMLLSIASALPYIPFDYGAYEVMIQLRTVTGLVVEDNEIQYGAFGYGFWNTTVKNCYYMPVEEYHWVCGYLHKNVEFYGFCEVALVDSGWRRIKVFTYVKGLMKEVMDSIAWGFKVTTNELEQVLRKEGFTNGTFYYTFITGLTKVIYRPINQDILSGSPSATSIAKVPIEVREGKVSLGLPSESFLPYETVVLVPSKLYTERLNIREYLIIATIPTLVIALIIHIKKRKVPITL